MSSDGALFLFPDLRIDTVENVRRLIRSALPDSSDADVCEEEFLEYFDPGDSDTGFDLFPRSDPDTLTLVYVDAYGSIPRVHLYGSTERIEVFRRAWSAARRIAVEFGAHGVGSFGLDLTELPFSDRSFYKTPQSRVLNVTLFPQPYRDRIPDEMLERFDQLVELDNGALETHVGWPFESPDDFIEGALSIEVMKTADDRLFEMHQFLDASGYLERIFAREGHP